MSALPPSLLKEVINKLPANWITKRESVLPHLKKMGVKEEELEASGMNSAVLNNPDKRLNKEQLKQFEINRKENIEQTTLTVKDEAPFITSTLPGANLDTYRVNLRKFNFDPRRKAQTHFSRIEKGPDIEDVQWHTRTTDESIGDHDTRLIQEVQSDLFQQGRQLGFTAEEAQEKRLFISVSKRKIDREIVILNQKKRALDLNIREADNNNMPVRARDLRNEGLELTAKIFDLQDKSEKFKTQSIRLADREAREHSKTQRLADRALYTEASLVDEVIRMKERIGKKKSAIKTLEQKGVGDGGLKKELEEEELYLRQLNEDLDALEMAPSAERTSPFPPTPQEKTWLRKAMEQEVIDAVNDGKQAIGIPFEGTNINLGRSVGVQKWYETQVRSTMKKMAKAIGGEYKEVDKKRPIYRKPKTREQALDLLNTNTTIENIVINEYDTDELASTLIEQWDDIIKHPELQRKTGVIGQVIFPKGKDMTENLKLYSAGGVGGVALQDTKVEASTLDNDKVNQALSQNIPISDIQNYLTDEGFDPVEVKTAVDSNVTDKIRQAADEGISTDDIKSYMSETYDMDPENTQQLMDEGGIGFTPTGIPGEDDFPLSETIEPREFDAQVLGKKYRSMHAKYSTLGKAVGGSLGIDEYAKEAFKDEFDLSSDIVRGLTKHGVQARIQPNTQGIFPTYDVFITDPTTGEESILDEDFFSSLGNSEFEIGGALAAAGAGLYGLSSVAMHPALKALLISAGSSVGAAGGRALDIVALADATRELDNLKSKFVVEQMVDAGVADSVFAIVGTTAVRAAIGTVKILGKGMDLVMRGNLSGAHRALKDLVGLDDEQVEAIVKEFEQITGKKAPGLTKKAKAIHVISQTVPGAEDVVSQAAQINPRVGASIIRSIHERATNVIKSAKNITNDNIGVVIKDDLDNYTGHVKDYYGGIKNHAIDAMEDSGYKFDYDELTLEPLFKKIEGNIQNPAVLERFQARLEKVRALGQVADGDGKVLTEFAPRMRSFEDLLELRKVANEFKHNTRISGHGNFETINEIIGNLNAEIKKAVTNNMDQSDVWLKEWSKANIEYSKMLSLKDNVMFKALTAKGVNVEKVINNLVKDIKSIDGTFMQVMAKLPAKTRSAAEGAVMKKFIANHTVGPEGGLQAIHFPSLQKSLAHVGFTTPESRQLKRAISELANVFRNDVNIFRATGQLSTEKFTSYLTFDPIVRLKFVVANKSFNYFRRLVPGAKGEAAALVSKAAKMLENPANARAVDDLIKALPNDPELAASVKQLAIQYAKFGFEEHYPKVKAYKSGVPGRAAKPINGPLGKGIYWTTNKSTVKARSKVTGGKIESRKILPARIASEEDIKRVLGRDFDIKELKDNPQIIEKLKDELYLGITVGEDIMVFK